MKVSDIVNIEGIKLVSEENDFDREIGDLYTGDLLSWVMGHARGDDVCLLTVLNTINVIAVATLLDLSCVVFCEGVIPTNDIIEKANDEGINLFSSNDTTFHTALKIYQRIS